MGIRREATLAYSARNRRRKAEFALAQFKRWEATSVLLVGVSNVKHPTENLIEAAIETSVPTVVATGLADEAEGWRDYHQADGLDLPYGDDTFDVVYSNAVIEHVGGEAEQKQFVREHARVGRNFILTCPNRYFPIESHTDVWFKHWRRNWVDPRGSVTRLLSPSDLRRLVEEEGGRVIGRTSSPTLTAVSTRRPADR